MPPAGFEPTISAGERPQTYALDHAATGTDAGKIIWIKKKKRKGRMEDAEFYEMKIQHFCSPYNFVNVINSKSKRRLTHVTGMGNEKYVLVWKYQGKRPRRS